MVWNCLVKSFTRNFKSKINSYISTFYIVTTLFALVVDKVLTSIGEVITTQFILVVPVFSLMFCLPERSIIRYELALP